MWYIVLRVLLFVDFFVFYKVMLVTHLRSGEKYETRFLLQIYCGVQQ